MAKAVKLKSNEKEKEYTDEFQNEFQNNKKQPIHIMGPKNIIIIIWEWMRLVKCKLFEKESHLLQLEIKNYM